MLWLPFGNLFPILDCLAQPEYRLRCLVNGSLIPMLCWCPWIAYPFLNECRGEVDWGAGGEEKGLEERREERLQSGYKININKKKGKKEGRKNEKDEGQMVGIKG